MYVLDNTSFFYFQCLHTEIRAHPDQSTKTTLHSLIFNVCTQKYLHALIEATSCLKRVS